MTESQRIRLTDYASCAGWAGKLPVGALAQVLRGLPKPDDPNLLVGSDHFDDACIYRLDQATAIVTTLDFFPPLVDDPRAFGRIAAANSLSDIYAMGGKPIVALNIVGFPDKELPVELLGEILAGGAERVAAAGALVGGGHSVRDAEIKYGLAVTGVVHPDRIVTNAQAQPGDALVLTKPIGTGTLTTAAKLGRIAEGDLAESIDVMADLNQGACEAMLAVGAHAATDITGFGLLGHAHEMADASGVTVKIQAKTVPLLGRTMEFAAAGVLTRAHKSNREFLGDRLGYGNIDDTLLGVLADAQTSGGLLISVATDDVDRLVTELGARGTKSAAIIGTVTGRSPHTVVIE